MNNEDRKRVFFLRFELDFTCNKVFSIFQKINSFAFFRRQIFKKCIAHGRNFFWTLVRRGGVGLDHFWCLMGRGWSFHHWLPLVSSAWWKCWGQKQANPNPRTNTHVLFDLLGPVLGGVLGDLGGEGRCFGKGIQASLDTENTSVSKNEYPWQFRDFFLLL